MVKNKSESDEDIPDLRKVQKEKPQSANPGGRNKKQKRPEDNNSDVMEGENVANCEESENNDNKTECISIDDVSNCSEEDKNIEKSLEKAPVIITLEPNKKLSKIYEKNEVENESAIKE